MYETIREFGLLSIDEFNNETYSDKGYEFAMMILDRVKSNADEWSNNKEYSINQEFVPGESANVKLFNKDRDLFENHDEYKKLFSSIAKIENNEISKM